MERVTTWTKSSSKWKLQQPRRHGLRSQQRALVVPGETLEADQCTLHPPRRQQTVRLQRPADDRCQHAPMFQGQTHAAQRIPLLQR